MGKESSYFYAPFRPCPDLFRYSKNKTGQSSTTLQKDEHFPFGALNNMAEDIENHFCQGAKMWKQSF